jgi:hypothetical protein
MDLFYKRRAITIINMNNKNIPNRIFDLELKLMGKKNNYDGLTAETDKLIINTFKLKEKMNNNLFEYNVDHVLDLLEISETVRLIISAGTKKVNIYLSGGVLSNDFVIIYNYNGNQFEFRTKTDTTGMTTNVFKNNSLVDEYNLHREFIAFNFEKLRFPKFLENYVELVIKQKKEQRMGLLLLAYYYLIKYLQYIDKSVDTYLIMIKPETIKLKMMFDRNFDTHVIQKCYLNDLAKIKDIPKSISINTHAITYKNIIPNIDPYLLNANLLTMPPMPSIPPLPLLSLLPSSHSASFPNIKLPTLNPTLNKNNTNNNDIINLNKNSLNKYKMPTYKSPYKSNMHTKNIKHTKHTKHAKYNSLDKYKYSNKYNGYDINKIIKKYQHKSNNIYDRNGDKYDVMDMDRDMKRNAERRRIYDHILKLLKDKHDQIEKINKDKNNRKK